MAHVATITIDHTKVPGDLTDYVGLIVPDASAGYSALYALCLEGGGDIRLFKSDDTTELAREIVSFSVSAETGEIHYKYSGTLSSSVDTDIHVYADGSSADYAVTATYGRNAVWVGEDMVMHLQSATGESTGEYSPTNYGATDTSGKVGGAQSFDNDYILPGTPSFGASLNTGRLSFWLKHSHSNNEYPLAGFNSGDGQGLQFTVNNGGAANTIRFYLVPPGGYPNRISGTAPAGTINDNVFHKISVSWERSSGSLSMYVDGVALSVSLSNGSTGGSFTAFDRSIPLGARRVSSLDGYYTGSIDEFRMKVGSRASANWEETEYNNQNSPTTFYSVAAVAGGSAAQAARRGVIMMM